MLQKRGERDATRVHSGGVNAALVTADGSRAVTLSKDCTARVWDLRSGACTDVLVGEVPDLAPCQPHGHAQGCCHLVVLILAASQCMVMSAFLKVQYGLCWSGEPQQLRTRRNCWLFFRLMKSLPCHGVKDC